MGLFGLINYENYLLNSLVTSSYAKNALMIVITYVITGLVRFHLSAFLCMIFASGTWFDLVTPIIITVLLSLASDNMYRYVKTHKKSYERLVDYIITSYSIDNFIRWKRTTSIVIGIYVTLALYLVEINNYTILLAVGQTTVSFVICDLLENNIPQSFIWRVLRRWKKEPTFEEFGMVDGFYFPPRLIQLASFQEMERTLQNNELTKNITTQEKQILRQQKHTKQLKSTKPVKSLIKSHQSQQPQQRQQPHQSQQPQQSKIITDRVLKVVPLIPEYILEKPLTPPSINIIAPAISLKDNNVVPLISLKDNEIIEQIADKALTPPMIRR